MSPAKAAAIGAMAKKSAVWVGGKGLKKAWCKAIDKEGLVEKIFQRIHSKAALDELINDIKKIKNVEILKRTTEKWMSKRGTAKEPEGDWAELAKDSGNTTWTQTALAHTISCWKGGTSIDFEDMKERLTCSMQQLKTKLITGVTPEEHRRRTVSVIRLLLEAQCNEQGPLDFKTVGLVAYALQLVCAIGNPNSNLNHFVEFFERSNAQATAIAGVKAEEQAKANNIVHELVQELYRKWREQQADVKTALEDKVFADLQDGIKNCQWKPFKNGVTCVSEKISSHVFTTEDAKKFAVKAAVGFCDL